MKLCSGSVFCRTGVMLLLLVGLLCLTMTVSRRINKGRRIEAFLWSDGGGVCVEGEQMDCDTFGMFLRKDRAYYGRPREVHITCLSNVPISNVCKLCNVGDVMFEQHRYVLSDAIKEFPFYYFSLGRIVDAPRTTCIVFMNETGFGESVYVLNDDALATWQDWAVRNALVMQVLFPARAYEATHPRVEVLKTTGERLGEIIQKDTQVVLIIDPTTSVRCVLSRVRQVECYCGKTLFLTDDCFGWDKWLLESEQRKLTDEIDSRAVCLKMIRPFVAEQEVMRATFVVSNGLDKAITFFEVGEDGFGYDIEIKERDKWQGSGVTCCATGRELKTLASGATYEFEVRCEVVQGWRRVALEYWTGEPFVTAPRSAFSEQFSLVSECKESIGRLEPVLGLR